MTRHEFSLRQEAYDKAIEICQAGMIGTSEKYAEACFECAALIKEQIKLERGDIDV